MPTTTSMTRKELIKRVALRAELTKQESGVKVARTDEPSATLLEEALDDGVREFWRSHNWSFALLTLALTLNPDGTGALNIDSDPRRYLLPAWVESLPKGNLYWKGPDGEPGGKVAKRHMDQVAGRAYAAPEATGAPVMLAGQWNPQLAAGVSESGRFELMVDPAPDLAYRVRVPVRVGPIPFVADHQVGVWPSVHDLTVVDFAVEALFSHDKDMGEQDQARAYAAAAARAQRSLARSIERDDEDFRPDELGAAGEDNWPAGRVVELTDLTTNEVLVRVTSFS